MQSNAMRSAWQQQKQRRGGVSGWAWKMMKNYGFSFLPLFVDAFVVPRAKIKFRQLRIEIKFNFARSYHRLNNTLRKFFFSFQMDFNVFSRNDLRKLFTSPEQ